MIYINQVLQSVKDSTRIRIIEIEESYLYFVNIDAVTSMPKKELYTSLLTDIEQKEWLIIPDPFAIPPMVTVFPATSISTAICFSQVSVVMIAFAASVPFASVSFFFSARAFTPATMRSIGSCFPMTPVDPINTPSALIPRASAAASAVSLQ